MKKNRSDSRPGFEPGTSDCETTPLPTEAPTLAQHTTSLHVKDCISIKERALKLEQKPDCS